MLKDSVIHIDLDLFFLVFHKPLLSVSYVKHSSDIWGRKMLRFSPYPQGLKFGGEDRQTAEI